MSYGLGIDLGTSFTRAAINRGGQSRMVSLGEQSVLMPSIVGVRPDGTLVVGRADATDDPGRTGRDFKRRLGDPTPLVLGGVPHSAVSLLAATLRSVIEILTAMEGAPPDRVVLTYPAVWGPYRREQFAEVPRLAGLDDVILMTEPEAAAQHYATRHPLADGQAFAIYDLGGGTFDSTVTRKTSSGMQILGLPEGVEWVGGVDFDEAVLAHVDQAVNGAISALDPREPIAARALQRIREECVRAKEQLSRDQATNIVVLLPHRHTQVRLTRAEFEATIQTPLEATLAALRRTIRSASVEIEDLAGVLLVGGSSRIPLISRMLGTDLGRPVLTDPRPQHCVALGAAVLAGAGLAGSNDRSSPRRPSRQLRRRIVAATATTALLVGGGAYAALQLAPSDGTDTPSTSDSGSGGLPVTGPVLGPGGRCLDITNAIPDDGAVVQLFGCNGSPAQNWTLQPDGTVQAFAKCLSTGPAATGAEAGALAVQLQTCAGTANQRWTLQNGAIVNQQADLCLKVVGDTDTDRTPLVATACGDQNDPLWSLPPNPASNAISASAAQLTPGRTIAGLGRRPQGIATSPDGRQIFVPNVVAETLSVIDTTTGTVVRKVEMPAAPQYVTVSPDGRRLYVTLNDPSAKVNSVQVVDTLTWSLVRRIKIGKQLFAPAVSPDGSLLYVPDHGWSRIVVLDTASYAVKAKIKVPTAPHGVVFSPDGLRAYAVDHESSVVTVLDVSTNRGVDQIPVGISPVAVAMAPDGRQLAVANYDAASVTLINLADNDVEAEIAVGKQPLSVAYAPDGRHLYAVNDGSDSLSVIDVGTGKVTSTVETGREPWTVALSPDGRHAYVVNATADTVTVFDTAADHSG